MLHHTEPEFWLDGDVKKAVDYVVGFHRLAMRLQIVADFSCRGLRRLACGFHEGKHHDSEVAFKLFPCSRGIDG